LSARHHSAWQHNGGERGPSSLGRGRQGNARNLPLRRASVRNEVDRRGQIDEVPLGHEFFFSSTASAKPMMKIQSA
jgi:hypothetical protein